MVSFNKEAIHAYIEYNYVVNPRKLYLFVEKTYKLEYSYI